MEENVSLQVFGRAIPFTKETQKSTAAALVAKITDGDTDPISMFTTIKAMNDCLSQFLKDQAVVEATIGAVEKYGRTGATFNGANLCIAEVGVRFDFSACQDTIGTNLPKKGQNLRPKSRSAKSSCAELQPRRQSLTKKPAK